MPSRTDEARNYLLAETIKPISSTPIDFTDEYYNEWLDRRNGTLMPPSPGVSAYHSNFEYDDISNVIRYRIVAKWKPIVPWLVRNMPRWQVLHRSRGTVLAFSPLRVNEQTRKVRQVREWMDAMKRHALSAEQSNRLYDAFLAMTEEALALDSAWITKYLRKHETSSIGGGFKWRDLQGLTTKEWADIYHQVKEMVRSMREHPGHWINIKWNTGLRARSDPITDSSVPGTYTGEMDRTRIIQFHPVLSLMNVFLPDKKTYYEKVLRYTESFVNAGAEFHYPYVEGGNIYATINNLYHEGYKLNALDGKTWEASVGVLLGPAFTTLMMYVDGIPMLPSGGFHTSSCGTMANVVSNAKTPGHIVALGDDMSVFTKKGHRSGVPWIEEDPGDTEYKVTLGVSYGVDIDLPRITGIKMMSDRAKKAIPIRVDDIELQGESFVVSKKTDRETALWAGLYMGRFGDKSLIEILKGIDTTSRDYVSPGEIIEDIVSGAEQTSATDPFAWAEELGVKKVIIQ